MDNGYVAISQLTIHNEKELLLSKKETETRNEFVLFSMNNVGVCSRTLHASIPYEYRK